MGDSAIGRADEQLIVLLSKSRSTFPLMRRDKSIPIVDTKVNRVIEQRGTYESETVHEKQPGGRQKREE